jgi:hypothetical protein
MAERRERGEGNRSSVNSGERLSPSDKRLPFTLTNIEVDPFMRSAALSCRSASLPAQLFSLYLISVSHFMIRMLIASRESADALHRSVNRRSFRCYSMWIPSSDSMCLILTIEGNPGFL